MKINKKLNPVALPTIALMLFLILVSSTAPVATAQSASSMINTTKIPVNVSAIFSDIYEDRIVYYVFDDEAQCSDLYMYDLSTKKETKIPTSGSVDFPKIYGDRIVYSILNTSNGRSDIYMYNLSTSEESQITNSGIASFPEIYGDRIVYYVFNDETQRSDIYMYDLSIRKETPIIINRYPGIPAIYGDRIVYHEWNSRFLKHSDIKMYNVSTSEETQINTSGSAVLPAIYGDRIVYYDANHEKPEIYMYDLSTKKETKITTNETSNGTSNDYGSLTIYGNRVVWLDQPPIEEIQLGENLYRNIYVYDLLTSNGTKISTTIRDSFPCFGIYGNRIVWSSDGNIYMYTVPGENTELEREDTGSNAKQQSQVEKNKSMPGFEVVSGIICLFGVLMYRKK